MLFTLGVALVTGLAFGLLPALQATGRTSAAGACAKAAVAGRRPRRASRARRARGGRDGALGRAADRRRAADSQLRRDDPRGAGLHARTGDGVPGHAPGDEYANAASRSAIAWAHSKRGSARFRELRAVAATTVLPLSGQGSLIDFSVVGAPPPPPDINQEIAIASVTPDYFARHRHAAAARPRLHGRRRDRAPPVAIINEAAVRRWFKDQDPIGRQVEMSGVRGSRSSASSADVRQRHPGQPVAPQLFTPYAQRTSRTVRIVVRSAADPVALAPSIRARDPHTRSQPGDHRLHAARAAGRTVRWRGRASTPRCSRCLPAWRWRWRRPASSGS